METLFLLMKKTRAKKFKIRMFIIDKICSGGFCPGAFWLGGVFVRGFFVLSPRKLQGIILLIGVLGEGGGRVAPDAVSQ